MTTAPISRPATAAGPNSIPTTIGAATAIDADFQSSPNEATVATSTHFA